LINQKNDIPFQIDRSPNVRRLGKVAGFSLHAGVAAGAHERDKLERLCRYIARPAVSAQRLSMTRNGQVRYELKTLYRNGTTHVIFEPLDLISRPILQVVLRLLLAEGV
jgi:hypothetical protein